MQGLTKIDNLRSPSMHRSAKSVLAIAALLIAAATTAHASTVDIDFTGVPTTQLLTTTNSYSEYGFTISSNSQFYENKFQGDPPPGINTATPGSTDTFTITDGGLLFALDRSEERRVGQES